MEQSQARAICGGDGFTAKIDGIVFYAKFPITHESLAPYLPQILELIPTEIPQGVELEAGIYGPNDVRVWKVTRGI